MPLLLSANSERLDIKKEITAIGKGTEEVKETYLLERELPLSSENVTVVKYK